MEQSARLKKPRCTSKTWTSLLLFSCWKIHQAVLSLGRLCVENGFTYEWKPTESSSLIKHGKSIKCRAEHSCPSCSRWSSRTDSSNAESTSGNRSRELPERLEPFTERMIEETSSSSSDTIPKAIPPLVSTSEKPSSNKPGGKHDLFAHFPKDSICEVCRQTKITIPPCERSPEHGADRLQRAEKFGDILRIDIQWSFQIWPRNRFKAIHAKM